ncbi:MAG: hypothetical protein Q8M40_05935, partial [Legionella sp.]|nr:hypothetical protein [Legionella sp.]
MKFKTDKSTLDNHLLNFGIAFKPKKAEVTWTTNPQGELDIERYFIAQDPACFRTSRIINKGIQLKTIVLADPTLNGALITDKSVVNIHRFLQHLYLNYPDAQVYIWTKSFILLKNASDFLNLYDKSAPLLKSEFEEFKKSQQVNNDEIILLDQTNLYYFSNSIHISFKVVETNAKYNDTLTIPELVPGCYYFTSEQFMQFDKLMLKKVREWHQEYNHPLHIQLRGFAESKLIDFIEEIIKYPQIIIYFEDISLFAMEIWLPYLELIPKKQIIGLKRTSPNESYAPNVDEILLDFIKSLKHLKHLFFEIEYLDETSINILDFSQNNQLEYLYLLNKIIPPFVAERLQEKISRRTIPNSNVVKSFLFSLPKGLKYLHLPWNWTYSLQTLTTLLTSHFSQLRYLGSNTAYDMVTINYVENHENLRGKIKIIEDANPIVLPATTVNSEFEPIIKGLPSSSIEYTPFAAVGARDADLKIINLNINDIYTQSYQYIQDNNITSIEELIDYINQLKQNLIPNNIVFTASTNINIPLLSIVLYCLGEIEHFTLMTTLESSRTSDMINETLLGSMIEFSYSYPPKVNSFHYTNFDTLRTTLLIEKKVIELLSNLNPKNLYFILNSDSQRFISLLKSHFHKFKFIYTNLIPILLLNNQYPETVFILNEVVANDINQSKQIILDEINRQTEQSKTSESMLTLDSDTVARSGQVLSARNIFTMEEKNIKVDPNYYRIDIYSNLNPDYEPWNFTARVALAEGESVYNGTLVLYPKDNKWLTIPTLHASDYLYSLEVTDNPPVEIVYCKNRSSYFIRPKDVEVTHLKINYTVFSKCYKEYNNSLISNPDYIYDATELIPYFQQYFNLLKTHIEFTLVGIFGIGSLKKALPHFKQSDFIQLICAYFASFDSGELTLSNYETLEQSIFYQKKGACRHRAILAYHLFKALNIPVCLVFNDVHAFLELKADNQWIGVCLGGYEAQVQLENSPSDELEKLEKFKEQMIIEEDAVPQNKFLLPYVSVDLPLVDNLIPWLTNERKRGGKVLLLVDSLEHVAHLQQLIEKEIKRTGDHFTTFDPNLPSSLSLNQLKASPSGERTTVPSALGQCLLNGKPHDMLFFITKKQYNLTLLNPLLDHRRTLVGKKVPELFIFAVMEKNIPLTPEIISRYSRIYSANRTPIKVETKHNLPEESSEMDTESFFIFGEESISFKNFAGTLELKGRQLVWRDGWLSQKLTSDATKKKEIILVNPPDTDEFHHLMHTLSVGYLMINGERVNVPEHLSFEMIEAPYPFPQVYTVLPGNADVAIDFVLNSVTYMSFIQGNFGGVNGALHQFPAVPLHESITLLVTSNFSDAQWYTLFQYAAENNIQLQLIAAAHVDLPYSNSDEDSMDESVEDNPFKPHLPDTILWINHDDPTLAIRHIETEEPILKFYISNNMTSAELFGSLTIADNDSGVLQFVETPFTHALKSGKKMIVYGNPDT